MECIIQQKRLVTTTTKNFGKNQIFIRIFKVATLKMRSNGSTTKIKATKRAYVKTKKVSSPAAKKKIPETKLNSKCKKVSPAKAKNEKNQSKGSSNKRYSCMNLFKKNKNCKIMVRCFGYGYINAKPGIPVHIGIG